MGIQLHKAMNSCRPNKETICAVIVAFNPSARLAANARAIAHQVAQVLVVDNGSAGPGSVAVADAARVQGVEALLLPRNTGIAAALNTGIACARDRHFQWVITLDQDSTPEPDMVARLAAVLDLPGEGTLAIVAPILFDDDSGTFFQRTEASMRREKSPSTYMTSGSLTNVRCWEETGGFMESLFIDYVDHEYCLRCAELGWRSAQGSGVLHHKLGSMRRHRILGLRFRATHHSVRRRYYIARNRIVVWRRYWRRFPLWVLSDVLAGAVELAKILLAEKDRGRKLVAMCIGIWDAGNGLLGERNYRLFDGS